ncbi:hypothetical protein [Pseudogemmobacter humi]|uniref:Lipoprotein n=1 Tax=Pseudogemmobacter humi TaxID=2483812 RepID=A0A3P5XRV9_9RHOB|nr:hypothetical protein [Pseudogemmobacter humi]VDC31705.1 hypothetical protein XINFAN_03077 [Pseudogemmobacter humi]
MTRPAPLSETARARCLPAAAAAVLLSGCVAGGTAAPLSRLVPGEYQVSVGGDAFWGDVRPGAPGIELTAGGARPVPGHEIRIRPYAGFSGLGGDAGALAKKAARLACQEAGGRFNETAIGAHDRAGAWIFRGGCA